MTGWASQAVSGFAAPEVSQSLEAATGQPVAAVEQELATGSAHGASCTWRNAASSY